MQLFQPRAIKSKLTTVGEIPLAHKTIIDHWIEGLNEGRFEGETENDDVFISQILIGILGYSRSHEGGDFSLAKNISLENGGNVDVAIGTFTAENRIIYAPFELKGAKSKDLDAYMGGRHKSPVQQASEYAAVIKGARFYLVSNYREIRLYGVGQGRNYELFELKKLTDKHEYAKFMLLLSRENFLSGATEILLRHSDEIGKSITHELYLLYKGLRLELIDDLTAENDNLDALDVISYAQIFLDRFLFIAFAQSRGLLPENILQKTINHIDPYFPRPAWDSLQVLFKAIDKGSPPLKVFGYNGGLFKENAVLDALKVSDKAVKRFLQLTQYDFATEVSVTVLGHIFENSITDIETLQALARGEEPQEKKGATTGKRKREGVVYTPPAITDFILEQTLGSYLAKIKAALKANHVTKQGEWKNGKGEENYLLALRDAFKAVKVLDSSCGSGAFLVAAFDYLHLEYSQINTRLADVRGGQIDLFDLDKEILTSNLYGVDVNFESIEISKLSLWLKTAKQGKTLTTLDDNLKVGDSLIEDSNFSRRAFTWREDFKEIMESGGFDVVIGNPPYVRMEHLKHLKPYLEKRYEVTADRADLYSYFYENGLRLLKNGGHLGYISSSTFFRTGSGKNLRQHLLEKTSLITVLDFGDLQVFEGVTTYPAILIMAKEAAGIDHRLNYMQMTRLPDVEKEERIQTMFEAGAASMPQSRLTLNNWKFEDDRAAALRAKIISNNPTLKQVYGSPCRGIVTGLNEAFVIDRKTRDNLVRKDPKCENLIKPFLEGKDLKQWRQESRDMWIIYIPKKKIDIENYPSLKAHLLPFKPHLEARATEQHWFELQQAQDLYVQYFEKPKIVYAHFQSQPLFSMDKKGLFTNNKCYLFINAGFFELALVNSKVMWFIFKSKTTMVRGGFYEATTQNIETLPIPPATESQKAAIATLAEKAQGLAETRFTLEQDFQARIHDFGAKKLTERLKNCFEGDFQAFRKEVNAVFKADIPLRDRKDWEEFFVAEKQKHFKLTNELNQIAKAINTQVYALFHLTKGEIELLENGSYTINT